MTTVFSNQRLFTDSVRDFYAYLAGILSRYDLAGEEYAQFKELLLVYIDLITADVNRHAPAVAHRASLVLTQADRLLQALASLPGLTSPDGTQVERAQGRTRTDWEELAAWYGASHGASGPEQLRGAAGQALGQLITNAKRLRACLSAPSLQPLWPVLRDRLEHTGHAVRGAVTVDLDDGGADQLSGLLGRPLRAGTTQVKLAALDAALRSSPAGRGLVAVVAELTGGPLRDRPAERDQAHARREQLWAELDRLLARHGLAGQDWTRPWTD